MIYVLRFWDPKPPNSVVVSTVSKSETWSKGLSPFVLGPVKLYGGYTARNVENAWQFSKVYGGYSMATRPPVPTLSYFRWAQRGWQDEKAHRYPMGKGTKPLYSWWNNEALDYVTARKRIYCPLYAKAVEKTNAYQMLATLYKSTKQNRENLVLLDYDAYDHRKLGMNLRAVLNCPTRKMGHAFVLMMMLLGKRRWEDKK